MKKALVIIVSALSLVLIGGAVLYYASYQQPVTSTSLIRQFEDRTFQADVLDVSKTTPVLVDFHASWCMPCKLLDPILEEAALELRGKAVVGKIDTDKNLISRKLEVNKIPAIYVIRNGEVKNVLYGVVPKEDIIKAAMEHGTTP